MPRVLVPLANGFEEMEGIIIIDVLRRAGIDVVVAGITPGEIVASRKTRHLADCLLDDVKDESFDMVILPGGGPGAKNLAASETLKGVLLRMHGENRWIGAICAAPNVLRKHGIISGDLRYTQHPDTIGDASGGAFVTDRVVESGRILTSLGPGTSFEFALLIVERLCGKETRHKVAGPMHVAAE